MATGILARRNLSASVTTMVYTCPANNISTVSLNVCNRSAASIRLTLWLSSTASSSSSSSLGTEGYLEKSAVVSGYTTFERAGLVLGQYNGIFAWTSQTAAVSLQIYGFEELSNEFLLRGG